MAFSKQEFIDCLKQLDLSSMEAAKLLAVSRRTVNRWSDNPEEISGPAEQALRAWLRLCYYNLPWRPDAIAIAEDVPEFPEQISLLRNKAILLDVIIQKAQNKYVSTMPWHIDLNRGIARLETIEVRFYKMPNGCFSPAMYKRGDQQSPDLERDRKFLEDAIFCIHQALLQEKSHKRENNEFK